MDNPLPLPTFFSTFSGRVCWAFPHAPQCFSVVAGRNGASLIPVATMLRGTNEPRRTHWITGRYSRR
jgi:hypothetical protein